LYLVKGETAFEWGEKERSGGRLTDCKKSLRGKRRSTGREKKQHRVICVKTVGERIALYLQEGVERCAGKETTCAEKKQVYGIGGKGDLFSRRITILEGRKSTRKRSNDIYFVYGEKRFYLPSAGRYSEITWEQRPIFPRKKGEGHRLSPCSEITVRTRAIFQGGQPDSS